MGALARNTSLLSRPMANDIMPVAGRTLWVALLVEELHVARVDGLGFRELLARRLN
jgi:hypothetical protein